MQQELGITAGLSVWLMLIDAQGELYFMGNQTAGTTGATGKLIKLESTLFGPAEVNELCFPIVADNGSVTLISL